jgi:GDP-mannose 6-dehydrogenase
MVDLMALAASVAASRSPPMRNAPCSTATSPWSASARLRPPMAARTRARSCGLAEDGPCASPARSTPHIVVFRSTLVPGTVEDVLRPDHRSESGKKDGEDFHLCFQPEFLREGSSIRDYDKPPFTVVGRQPRLSDRAPARAVRQAAVQVHRTSVRSAEMMKYCCNNFHALKITFANETARLCEALGVDPFEVMDLVCQDTQLNISTAYLRPGFAFGGSCLPKDLRATTYLAKMHDVEVPMLAGIMQSTAITWTWRCASCWPSASGRSASSACRSRPAPTTCARAPGDAGRTAHRQGHATRHLRPRGPSGTACWGPTAASSNSTCRTSAR